MWPRLLLLLAAVAIAPVGGSFYSDYCSGLGGLSALWRQFPLEYHAVRHCCERGTLYEQDRCFTEDGGVHQGSAALFPFTVTALPRLLAKIEHVSRVAPTVLGATTLDVNKAVKTLRDAIEGLGTDEDAIIRLFASVNSQQRFNIAFKYYRTTRRTLRDDIRGDTSGSFKDLLIALMYTPTEHDAWLVREYTGGYGTYERGLVDAIATNTLSEVLSMREAYQRFYRTTLKGDLRRHTGGGKFTMMLETLVGRYDNDVTQETMAALLNNTRNDDGSARPEMVHVHETCRALVLAAIYGREHYFAARLHDVISGVMTRDAELIGLVTSRVERDMAAVLASYEVKYKRSFTSDIKDELSGDYRKLMLAIL